MSLAKMLRECVWFAFFTGVIFACVFGTQPWWIGLPVAFVAGFYMRTLEKHAGSIGKIADDATKRPSEEVPE